MLNLKKTAVAVLAFGSSAVFAGTMGPVCTPGNVTVPCEATAWEFGAQALYLQPNLNGQLGFIGATVAGVTSSYVDSDPRWGWGFMVEAGYHFGTGNDFNLNWYHLSRSFDRDVAFDVPFDGTTVSGLVDYHARPQWDAVNFEFGQHADFGEFVDLRFHGGAQYARLKTTHNYSGFETATPTVLAATESASMTFNGFGPRAGFDMTYNWGNGFATYAKSAAALLVGSSKFSHDFRSVVLPADNASFNGSRTRVVPELEGKLGATYSFAMAAGDLTLDAGYMWINYFNAHHGINFNYGAFGVAESDFSLNGPYFGLKWVGNVV